MPQLPEDAVELLTVKSTSKRRTGRERLCLVACITVALGASVAAEPIDDVTRQAEQHVLAGEPDRAVDLYRRAIAEGVASARHHAELGALLTILGRTDEGTRSLRRAAELEPSNTLYGDVLAEVGGSTTASERVTRERASDIGAPAPKDAQTRQQSKSLTERIRSAPIHSGATADQTGAGRGSTATLRLDETVMRAGEFLSAFYEFEVTPREVWLTIVPHGTAHGSAGGREADSLFYMPLIEPGEEVDTAEQGTLVAPVPTEPGRYELRLYDAQDGGRELASVEFRVR